jgi:hypothetical protein
VRHFIPFAFLVLATTLEASGDAIIRVGLRPHPISARIALMLAGTVILYGYGLTLNLAPLDWGRLIGAYVATFFCRRADHQPRGFRNCADIADCCRRPFYSDGWRDHHLVGALAPAATRASHFDRLRAGGAGIAEVSALHLDVLRDLKQVNAHLVAAAAYPVLKNQGDLLLSRLRLEE